MMMARCLRCGADSAWIEGKVLPSDPEDTLQIAELQAENENLRVEIDDLRILLAAASDENEFFRGNRLMGRI